MDKITFSNLSTSLKVLVVICWIGVGIYTLFFMIGFILGIMGAI